MSTLKRTPENFPKMKVRGKGRPYKRIRQYQKIADMRINRFNEAMRILGFQAQQVGMRFTVLTETLQKLEEANKYEGGGPT